MRGASEPADSSWGQQNRFGIPLGCARPSPALPAAPTLLALPAFLALPALAADAGFLPVLLAPLLGVLGFFWLAGVLAAGAAAAAGACG